MRSDAQIYKISLSSSISVFDDYTLIKKSKHTAQAELTVTVIDPCLEAQIPELIIPDLEINVHEGAATQSIPDLLDSVSESITASDGNPFCGQIILELLEDEKHKTYLNFADRTLTALSTDDSEIGIYGAQLHVYLEEYPAITKRVEFNVIVSPCQAFDILIESGPEDSSYAITSDEMKLSPPTVNQGVCQYPVTYEILEPWPFMTLEESTGELTIQTDVRSYAESYLVLIIAHI